MKERIYSIMLFTIGLLFYILTLRGAYGNISLNDMQKNLDHIASPFESSHERGPYVLMISLLQQHSFGFNEDGAKASFPDVGYSAANGKYYIFFPPGVSLLIAPFFLLGMPFHLGQVFAFAVIPIFAAGLLVFLFKIAKDIFNLPIWSSLIVALTFGFGSIAWAYSVTIYQHIITDFLIMSAFYAVWKFKQQSGFGWVWGLYVWFAYSFAIFVDYPNALLMFPVIVYFLLSSIKIFRKRSFVSISVRLAFIFTFFLFISLSIVHAYYNYKNFGSWKQLSGGLIAYQTVKQEKLIGSSKGETRLLFEQNRKTPALFFHEEDITNGLYELLISVDRGIFLYSPIFILAVFGIVFSFSYLKVENSVLLGIIVVNLFLYSSWSDPYGGWSFGPRYLIPAMAPLSIFVGIWLSRLKNILLARITVFLLFAISSAIALLGALTTNLIPPKSEALPLHIRYDFMTHIDYIQKGITPDFIYNQLLTAHLTLVGYYLFLYEAVLLVVYLILFIMPNYARQIEKP